MYNFTAKDISQKLSDNIDGALSQLLPNGRARGREYHVGSTQGEPGDSLLVCLSGPKKGVWSDFSTGEGGDLLDLWASVRSVTLKEALLEASGYLGITGTKIAPPWQNKYVRPKMHTKSIKAQSTYLTATRKLTQETLSVYCVHVTADDEVVFPSYRNKELVLVKYLKIDRADGKKKIWASKDSEPCLFGWQSTTGRSRKLCLTEGEFDAMSLYQYGIGMDVMSVPFGGGAGAKHQWIENEFDNLNIYDEIYLCLDGDEKGQQAAKDIRERLGSHRCLMVTLPWKDANECLQKGETAETIKACFDGAFTVDPDELKGCAEYYEQMCKLVNGKSDADRGYPLPWAKTVNTVSFRPGELTVWSGVNSHGKSQFLGYLMLHQISLGARVCIASFEMPPAKTMVNIAKQATAQGEPSNERMLELVGDLTPKLWIFQLLGTAKGDRLIQVLKYARQRYGINVFVIDALMKCGLADDDYAGQKKFLDQLADFKNEFNCHVHIVAHLKKSSDESLPPSRLDVKGVSGITDLADNCMIIWRNKAKEKKMNVDKMEGLPYSHEDLNSMDGLLICDKQRFGDWEGKIKFWFDKETYQYLPTKDDKPQPFRL